MDEYLNLLRDTFLVNEEIDKFNGEYVKKENLLNGYLEAEKNLDKWTDFIKVLRQQNNVRVRDMKEGVEPYSLLEFYPMGMRRQELFLQLTLLLNCMVSILQRIRK